MGLMDKVKQGAGQALNKAQQGVTQGKAKIDEKQAKHQWDGLLRNLGAAYYAQQRQDGPSDAVSAAMSALDEHLATHGPVEAGDDDNVDGSGSQGSSATGGWDAAGGSGAAQAEGVEPTPVVSSADQA